MRLIPRKKQKNRILFYNVTVWVLLIAIFLVFCDTRVRPVIKKKVRDCARTDATLILNEILLNQIEKMQINYSDIALIKYTADGKISSIKIDTSAVNKFKSSFALSVSKELHRIDQFRFSMRLGTLIGPEFFTEIGPKIPFKVSSSEFVQTEVLSRFEEAGINQTVHRILLDVSINIRCYFPGYSTSVNVESQLTLAETVIIGTVPQFYAGSN